MKVKFAQSYLTFCNPVDSPWNSPGQNAGVGSLSLLQGIVPTLGLNPSLLNCRWILCQLSHKGSPKILKWVAYPFFSRSSWPRNWTGVSCIAGGFFTKWAIREAQISNRDAFPKTQGMVMITMNRVHVGSHTQPSWPWWAVDSYHTQTKKNSEPAGKDSPLRFSPVSWSTIIVPQGGRG